MYPWMRLKDIESRLPPGFRFHPSDEELVCYYLRTKVASQSSQLIISPPPPATTTMVEVDLHTREPWELPEAAKLKDNEWYFFSFRDQKYAMGSRTNRATKHGYWKVTGKDKVIREPAGSGMMGRDGMVIGMRKTLVFYFGRAPNWRKSGWVMHEFRLIIGSLSTPPKEDWVLCRVFHKGKGVGDEQGSCNDCMITCSSNNIDPGSWPAALCSPPLQPEHLAGPSAAAPAADNLERQSLPISSLTINDQLQLLDSDQLMRQADAMLDSAVPLQAAADSCFGFPGVEQASTSTGELNSCYGGDCMRGMEMTLLQVGDCDDAVYYVWASS
ncbi:NAC transcription factor 32-like [Phragmites australis]|uniref:NAC transcription factor 32-like n=1 Tax=Phragmites australis TaxID=29695 RepID=UPI002D792141|nr:NAC transcription factor 32-like [Phragmites australis]